MELSQIDIIYATLLLSILINIVFFFMARIQVSSVVDDVEELLDVKLSNQPTDEVSEYGYCKFLACPLADKCTGPCDFVSGDNDVQPGS